ncbi:MAG: hypothetical protein MUF42_14495 [Cytophagaceae bacterium]|jgi:hypothetical protein|nr:hypothetical protein [Cytophagaceae bacterium]
MKKILKYSEQAFLQYQWRSWIEPWLKHPKRKKKAKQLLASIPESLHSTGIFLRIALALFTFILACSGVGLLSLMFLGGGWNEIGYGIFSIVCSVAFFFILENYISHKHSYGTGVDDMLTYLTFVSFMTGFVLFFIDSSNNDALIGVIIALCACLLASLLALRYVDRLCMLVALSAGYSAVFILFKSSSLGTTLLPFIGAALGGLTYWGAGKLRKNIAWHLWDSLWWMAEITGLVLLYASLNYYVVRNLSESLMGIYLEEGQDIPLAFIFYACTALIPLVYVWQGTVRKNRILFRTGLVLIALSAITFKVYFSTGHHEITLTVSGALLLLFSYGIHRWLQMDRAGLTLQEDQEEEKLLDAESLLIVSSVSIPSTQQVPKQDFGNGSFGGGGSTGDF